MLNDESERRGQGAEEEAKAGWVWTQVWVATATKLPRATCKCVKARLAFGAFRV